MQKCTAKKVKYKEKSPDGMAVTVLSTSYRSANTIFLAIDSVLSQTYSKIQYVIVDDGSGDFDKEALIDYIKRNNKGNIYEVIVLANEQNEGTVKALNAGISRATGEIIFNLASDDCFADETVIEDWVNEFVSSGADVVTAKRAVYDQEMQQLIRIEPNDAETELIKKCSPCELFEAMSGYNIIFGCCTARRKSSYEHFGLYDEKYRLIEDYPSIMKLLRLGEKIAFLDRVVIKYRTGGVSSVEGINIGYLKESDAIFTNEVLPYVKNSAKAKKAYAAWRSEVLRLMRYRYVKNALQANPRKLLAGVFVCLAYCARYPVRTLSRIKEAPSLLKKALRKK